MPLDTSIALGVKPYQSESPVNALASILQIQGAQQQNTLGQAKLDEYQRGVENENKLSGLYRAALNPDGSVDRAKLFAGAAQEGLGSKIPALQKNFADADEAAAKVYKSKLENTKTVNGMLGSTAAALAQDPNLSYQQVVAAAEQLKRQVPPEFHAALDVSRLPQDPAQLRIALARVHKATVDSDKLLADETSRRNNDQTNQTSRLNNQETNATSRANNSATVGATIRGQNMTDGRARETLQSGRVPSGYRAKADGTLEFIPGGPADPNAAKKASPTEFQGKSATFGNRAQEADRIIVDLTGKYSPAAINSKNAIGETKGVGGMLEAGANSMLSSESQRAEQAQRDFVNAVLRQESGAAIGKDEFTNARRQYFPQPGDGQDVIAQKAANRKRAVEGLLNNAGNARITDSQGGASGSFAAPSTLPSGWKVQAR